MVEESKPRSTFVLMCCHMHKGYLKNEEDKIPDRGETEREKCCVD
jgi:hypothetical protein